MIREYTATGSVNHDPEYHCIEVVEVDGPGHHSVLVYPKDAAGNRRVEIVPEPDHREDAPLIAAAGLKELGVEITFERVQ